MKKFTTLFVTGLLSIAAFAQFSGSYIPSVDKNPGLKPSEELKFKKTVNRRTDYGEWYTYTKAYEDGQLLGQTLTTFVRWMMPDTNAGFVYTDGKYQSVGIHVVGSMFDPKDSLFQSTGQEVLTKFNPYTVDTIAWTRYYIRNLDSVMVGGTMTEVVDTVVVQYFDYSGIEFRGFSFNNMSHINGSPKTTTFKTGSLRNTSALKTEYIYLRSGDKDSIDRAAGTIFGSTEFTVPGFSSLSTSNGLDVRVNTVAFSVCFKPMVAANLGDTIVNWNNVPTTNKRNVYGLRMAYLENNFWEITSNYRINNAFWTNAQLVFGAKVNGWASYLPTTAYNTGFFLPYSIHITTANLNNKDLNVLSGINVYPNPAQKGNVQVVFNSSKLAIGKVVVSDLNGRVVMTTAEQNIGMGENVIPVSADLASGIYMVSVQSTAGTQSAKLVVQ